MVKKIIEKLHNLSENDRIVLRNVIGAFLVKGVALVVSLLTMPAYMRFFNNEASLGLWFTMLAVLSWILNFDLGIGNGLRNHLTNALTARDEEEAQKYLSSSYISISVVCIAISVVFVILFDYVNWNAVFNIDRSIVSSEALLKTVKIVFVGIMMQMLLKLITSVLYALQKSSVNDLLTLLTSIITLIAVVILPSGDNDRNMVAMAVIHVMAVILPLLVATVVVFSGKRLRHCIPSFRTFSRRHVKQVLSLGGMFLLVQVAYMLLVGSNEYLLTLLCSNEVVVEYQIYFKPFSLGGTLFCLAMTPIWSAVTKAYTERNTDWIVRLRKKVVLFAGLGSFAEFMLIPFLQYFVNFWLGSNAISVDWVTSLPFAMLGCLIMFNSAYSSIANGIGELKTQAVCFCAGAVVKIPLSWIFIRVFGNWTGVIWSNVIALTVYCIVQPIVLKRYLNKKRADMY